MNSDIKTKWLEALRSGNYRQGQNVLHQQWGNEQPQYCCLGVLCDLAVREGVISPPEISQGEQDEYHVYEYESVADEVLPKGVMEWAGIDRSNPVLRDVPLTDSEHDETYDADVATLNDEGTDFNTLANLIERHL